jgi:epsilon-lactone hydrolase
MSEEMERILELLWAAPSNDGAPIEQRRADMDELSGATPLIEGTTTEAVEVAGRPAQWVRGPGAEPDAGVLYLHGGGYCVGSIASHTPLASRVSAASGAPVLVLDYRLGPEHPFPAAVEDAVAAYRALLDDGVDPGRLAIAGDSAGGGLTLATLLSLRDQGVALPSAAACISPWVDLTMSLPSIEANAGSDPMLARHRLQQYADWYLGDADPKDPLASPRFADLSGLPPVLLHVAQEEILLDEVREVAEAIVAAGGEVEHRACPGTFHVWHAVAGLAPEADQAVAELGDFVRARRSA